MKKLILLLFIPLISFSQEYQYKIKNDVNFRDKPSTNSNIIRVLKKDEIVKVSDSINNWFKLTDDMLNVGYVSKNYVNKIKIEAEPNDLDFGLIFSFLLIFIIAYFWIFRKLPSFKKNKKPVADPNSKLASDTVKNTTNHRWFEENGKIKSKYTLKIQQMNLSEEQIQRGFTYIYFIYENLKGIDFTKINIERQNNYPSKKDLLKNSSYWKFSFLGSAVLHNSFNKSDFNAALKKLLNENSIDESSKISKKDYDYWEGNGFIIEIPKSKESNLILISNNNVINSERICASLSTKRSITEIYYNEKYCINPNSVFFLQENMVIAKIFGVHLEDLQNIQGPTRLNSEIASDLIENKILPFTDEQINNGIANIEPLFFRNLKGIRFDKIQLLPYRTTENNKSDISEKYNDYEDGVEILRFFKKPKVIDGNWYFGVGSFIWITKSFSKNTINKELNRILKINNIDKKNKYSDINRDYWVGKGFEVEVPKLRDIYLITIINEQYSNEGADELRETEITNKTHNISWIKGLKIYDGKEVLEFDNTMQKAKNVPLFFIDEDADEYILIANFSTLTVAKSIINKIIDQNGGKSNFTDLKEIEPEKTKNWAVMYGGFKFNIGFLSEYQMIRINKTAIESVKELDKSLDSSPNWHQIIINRANWNDSMRNRDGALKGALKEVNSFWNLAVGHKDEYMLKYNNGEMDVEGIEYRIDVYNSFIREFEKFFYHCQVSNKKIPSFVYSKFLALVESLAGAELTKILMKEEGEDIEIESIYKRIKRPNDETIENPNDKDFVDKDEFTHYKGYLFNGVWVEDFDNETAYTPFRFGLKHGIEEYKYKNGQLKGKYRYFNDKLIETIKEYNEDGSEKKDDDN